MCIRDSARTVDQLEANLDVATLRLGPEHLSALSAVSAPVVGCLLYTSPSPRDGHLSIRRQRQDVYKRQCPDGGPARGQSRRRDPAAGSRAPVSTQCRLGAGGRLSLIHISEPTRRTPLYSSAASRCV